MSDLSLNFVISGSDGPLTARGSYGAVPWQPNISNAIHGTGDVRSYYINVDTSPNGGGRRVADECLAPNGA